MFTRIPLCLIVAVMGTASAHAQVPSLTRSDHASQPGARGAAAADFNNDGWADIAQSNTGRNSVTVLLNRRGDRDGFARQVDIPVGLGPFDMVTADFNLDRNADLAVANADGDTLSILLGRGNGTFTRTDIAAPGNPRGIATADVNRDGRPDIVYTAFGINCMQVLLGNGAGGFTQGWGLTGVAQRPQGIAPADFNKDGRVDVAVTYASPGGRLAVIYMGSDGRPSAQTIPGEDNLNVVATGDFNNDGWQDAAAASTGNSRLAVYLGSATGLRQVETYQTGASPRGLIAADVNHDGLLDLVAANKEANTIEIFTGRADAPGSFESMELPAGRGSRAPVAADFDHDGRLDLATGNQDDATATVFWNDTALGRAAYVFSEGALGKPENPFSDRIIVTDLNHNAVPDLIIGSYYIVDNTTSRAFPSSVEWVSAAADFNGDGHVDVAGAVRSAQGTFFDKIRLLTGTGTGDFVFWRDVQAPSRLGWIGAADMNRDGSPDVIAAGFAPSGPATLDVMLNRGDGTWAPRVRTVLPQPARDLALADLNRDGITDVLVTFELPEQLAVYLGTGGGAFIGPTVHGLGQYPARIATGDLNQDGSVDVVVGTFERMNVFLGSPAGGLTRAADVPVGGNQLAIADMNMDGHLDIIGGYPSSIVRGHGDGTFQAPDLFVFDFYLAIADMNLDGLPDIVTDQRIVQNRRSETNNPPVMRFPIRDITMEYRSQFGEEDSEIWPQVVDPDFHAVRFEWRNAQGTVVSTQEYLTVKFRPGAHEFTVTASDGRGGSVSDTFTITIDPTREIVMSPVRCCSWPYAAGTWQEVDDATAADGRAWQDPDAGQPKRTAPEIAPTNYLWVEFVADPTQTYKLWIRGKAQNNHWANDSVFVQFTGAANAGGAPVYRTGTTSSLEVNLEECSGCGLSGWGWRDERWGPTLTSPPVLLRFPQGGTQYLVIQSREDGLSIDHIVLSSEQYVSTRPGAARDDATILR